MGSIDRYLEVKGLEKSYQDSIVFTDLSFSLGKGECLSLLGPSGHGKSTLLKCIAGLEMADQGQIIVRGVDRSRQPTEKRKIVYLHQRALLFPHMNVEENIAFGLKARKIDKDVLKEKVDRWLSMTGLSSHKNKYPHQLSGGQQQRVAMARALIIEPDLVLLDEPFHALDQMLKQELYEEMTALFKDLDITSVLVTHDVREALILGTKFAWLENTVFKLFTDKRSFIEDPSTGVRELLAFWKKLEDED